MDVTNSLVFFGPAVSETTGSDRSIQKMGTKRPMGNVLACIKPTTRSNIGDLSAQGQVTVRQIVHGQISNWSLRFLCPGY